MLDIAYRFRRGYSAEAGHLPIHQYHVIIHSPEGFHSLIAGCHGGHRAA
jgi:hypothetical protein